MIRRDIDLGDGEARWLLVSQVEHARLGAVLAERCLDRFGPATAEIDSVRSELLQAIARHDDGWADWETRPGLDPELRRPLSFRELSLDETLANWDGSIRSAAEVGPLAAWAVAGHFAGLLQSSQSDLDEIASAAWLAKTADQRAIWLAKWQKLNPAQHSQPLADEALLWMRAFDAMSLWICSVCPFGGEEVLQWPEGYHIGPGESLDTRLAADATTDISEYGVVTADPWRFNATELEIAAPGHVVPVCEYRDTDELLAAYEPIELRWRLRPLTS
jgi:hypothetical protein